MINRTGTAITTTIYDQTTTNTIEGAVVYMQRYFFEDNIYRTVAMYKSDLGGVSYFNVDTDAEYYKFLVDYPYGTRVLTSEPLYVQTSNLNLYISTQAMPLVDFFDAKGISLTFSYNDALNLFTATWNDPSLVATEYCFNILEYGQYGTLVHNSSCTTTPSGSLSLMHPDINSTYYAQFVATISGVKEVIGYAWIELISSELNAGKFGLFLATLIVILFAFLSSVHVLALILPMIGFMFTKMLGLIPLSWAYVTSMCISAVILSIVLHLKK